MSRKRIVIITVILLLAIGGGVVWYYLQSKQELAKPTNGTQGQLSVVKVASVCSDDVIRRASSAIEPYDAEVLYQVSEEIRKIDRFNDDPNCQYILARYYIVTGQSDAAAKAVDRLQALQTAGGSYSLVFNPPAINVSDLRRSVETIKNASSGTVIKQDDLNEVDKKQ